MGNPTINEIPFCISGICRHPLILNKRRSPALATVFYRREEEHGRGRGTTTNAGEKRKTRSAGAAYPVFVLADQSGSTWFEKASSSYLITNSYVYQITRHNQSCAETFRHFACCTQLVNSDAASSKLNGRKHVDETVCQSVLSLLLPLSYLI